MPSTSRPAAPSTSSGDTFMRGIEALGSSAAVNEDCVQSLDCYGFASVNVQITGTWVGTLTFQGSNNGTDWVSVAAQNVGNTTSAASATTTANGIFFIPVCFRFFRVRMTARTSGTAVATAHLYEVMGIPLSVGGSVGISGNPTLAALPSGTNTIGQVRLSADPGQGTASLHHRIAAGSGDLVNVKNSAGNIGSLTISNLNASTACFIKLYNKTTAPVLASDTPVQVYRVPANETVSIRTGPFGIRCSTGISYALVTGVANTDANGVTANEVVVAMAYT